MKNEKIAILALVVIIVVSLSAYAGYEYGDEILINLFGEEPKIIKYGDCVDFNYIGKYASNGTIFESSYEDLENKTNGTPLQVFVTDNKTELPPEGYQTYSSDIIDGMMEGLIGLKKGDMATIGPIPPEKAYGRFPSKGDYINISDPATGEEVNIAIVDIIENTAMPEEYVDMLGNKKTTLFLLRFETYKINDRITQYPSWENATVVTKINETKAWLYTTPPDDKQVSFTWIELDPFVGEIPYWENASSITTINDSAIIITHTPDIDAEVNIPDWSGYTTYTVLSMTDEKINTSYLDSSGNTSYKEFDRTVTVQRNETQNITMSYPLEGLDQLLNIIKMYYNPDLDLGVSDLAGETLIFEVEIVEVYKTSQKTS
jgi:FKBP-type peptidyl-prolyl cis-trans isomerase 2